MNIANYFFFNSYTCLILRIIIYYEIIIFGLIYYKYLVKKVKKYSEKNHLMTFNKREKSLKNIEKCESLCTSLPIIFFILNFTFATVLYYKTDFLSFSHYEILILFYYLTGLIKILFVKLILFIVLFYRKIHEGHFIN